MRVCISSGHGQFVRGAVGPSPWGLDEVNEARRVVDRVAEIINSSEWDHGAEVFHDNSSRDQTTNLHTIVNYHNVRAAPHDLDVSVHFNSNGNTEGGRGTECFYYSQAALASKVAQAISVAGELTNRGGKKSTGLYFLVHCVKPAVLVEVCFVNAKLDCDNYKRNFENICSALASALVGQAALPVPPPEGPNTEARPTLGKGDRGPWVTYLQQQLNSDFNSGLATDGIFGSATDSAVRNYQASRHLSVDGICGPQTWDALETDAPPYVPPGLPPPMSQQQIDDITHIAAGSSIYRKNWKDRGVAPPGYTKGVAVAFANTYRQFLMDYPPAVEMSLANSHNSDKDVLAWEAGRFETAGMSIDEDGVETLCSLWAYILGLGMRESSGRYCTGRDQSASNTSSNTCEAGAWQTSFDAHNCSVNFNVLFDAYLAGGGANPEGFVGVFKEGASCGAADWENYGSGDGYQHQKMSKEMPAYAAEVCAITLRKLRQHYGPVNRREVEIVPAAFDMLMQVRDYIDEVGVVVA